jgi:ABC-type phosphate transport system substrate-binding protein
VAHRSTEEVFVRSISKRVLGGAAVAAAVAAALLAATAAPAAAEPTGTPAATDIVAAGSDTIQGVYDQFQADYSGLQSWDAVGGTPITPKASCASITRPNGSGAGINAIGANATTSDGLHYCINLARSSRTPSATDPTGLSFVALAGDAVSWAAASGGNAPDNLTGDQLYHIFHCDTGYLHWNDSGIGGTSSDAIVPVLPQSQSGTRSFFLSALNAAEGLSGSLTPGTCVDTTTSPEENEGTNAVFNTSTNPSAVDIVYPYSAAVYAAQVYNGHGAGDEGSLTIRNIDGTVPIVVSGTFHVENADFSTSFQRIVFDVVRSASLGDPTGKDGDLDSLINFECNNATGQNDLQSFGFGLLGFCGIALYTT